jgi:hypothetical protein
MNALPFFLPNKMTILVIVKEFFDKFLRDFHDYLLSIYNHKPKRFGVTQPFLTKEEKPLSNTQ